MEPIVQLSAQVMMKCSWQAETTIMQRMFLAVPDTSNSQTPSVAKQGFHGLCSAGKKGVHSLHLPGQHVEALETPLKILFEIN
ncbi:hypothetical protein OIU84_026073 [Salix udensis]|uniref:Uncharacterized protein n=1 Tax=Salix udensis TaxID=889485 RepID=A0AAD6PDV0_9ROSI|nr:hypothetical protein OIU84_026073 [Salix udensis]